MVSITKIVTLRTLAAVLAGALLQPVTPFPPTKAASSAGPCEQLCSAIPTVRRWLGYLEESKARKAWRLMTGQSHDAIGGFEEFKRESSIWTEGWGAWAGARNRDFELRVIAPKDDDADSVVTMTGRIARDGPSGCSAAALPLITREGITKVDPLHGRARISSLRPLWGEALTPRPRFKAIVKRIRARNNSVHFVVKGSKVEPQRAKLEKIGHRSYKATLEWPRRLGAGSHVVTLASWGRHGFKATAVRFKVRSEKEI